MASCLRPQSQGAQAQFWMALCGSPVPSPDGLCVLVGSMRSAVGGARSEDRQTLLPPLGTHTAQWEASSCHHPRPVQSQLPQRCPRLWHGSADGFPRVHWRPATLLEPKKMMSYKERLLGSRRGQVCSRETTAGLHGV